ncbi:hypothetical protein ACOMHN_004707 [Nucella lapillus]
MLEVGRMSRSWVLLTWAVVLTSWCDVTLATCPWDKPGLLRWSDTATWPGNTLPGFEDEVVISSNRQVLLDISPPSLKTLTVQAGSSLVWGNVDNLKLNATVIYVLGGFHLGNEDCRFTMKATINLYGRPDSPYQIPRCGRKVLGVGNGGTMEIHGQQKLPWTKLAHTIPAAADVSCAFLYDHQNTTLGLDTRSGLHVLVWNNDSSVRDFNIFDSADSYNTFKDFIDTLPDGVIVAAAVKTSIMSPPESVLLTFKTLGSNLIRTFPDMTTYAFIVRKGSPSSMQEAVAKDDDYLRLFEDSTDLEFHVLSSSKPADFKVMVGKVAHPRITLTHDATSWNVGDAILVTSTDYEWRQAEVKHLVECSDCANNEIRLDAPFENMHFGEITEGVDERAEVALLTRNILIEGQMEDTCHSVDEDGQLLCDRFGEDMYGGQVKATFGATVHIEAAYPLHFHLMNNASGMWFRNNSIHHSKARCVTVHGTHCAEVSDNVCYLHHGHGYFIEDAVEQNNTLKSNLGVGTQNGHLLLSDRKTEWCTEELGQFCEYPLGVSKTMPWISNGTVVKYQPIHFHGNTGHSNSRTGLFVDSRLSNGEYFGDVYVPENGVIPQSPDHEPREPPNENGTRIWITISNLTFYRNKIHNLWVKGGNLRVAYST